MAGQAGSHPSIADLKFMAVAADASLEAELDYINTKRGNTMVHNFSPSFLYISTSTWATKPSHHPLSSSKSDDTYLGTAFTMLDTIPSEISTKIVAFVNKSDLLKLRLASRRLRQETWQVLGSAFFGTVYFDFCIGSFASLQKVARHDGLRLFVRELRVGDQGSCNNDGCRALRTDHRLGQGYKWTRESSGCIDISASGMVTSFRTALTERLSNCRAIYMRQGMHERPGERGSDTLLSMTDAVHLLLFAVSGLPISSLRFASISGLGLQPQELPRRVIESPAIPAPWADALTELRLDWEIFPDQSDMVHIAASINNRANALRRLHLDLHDCDASAILSRLIETPEVSPLTHLVLRRFHLRERQLSSFLRRFKETLLYLHMSSITLDSGEWATILSESIHSLLLLEHFTLCDARYMSSQQLSLPFFDYILEWTGVPVSGRAEFVVKSIRTPQGVWRFRISGIRYQGQCNDMRTFLTGLEECARVNSQNHENEAARAAGWKREDLPVTLVTAGRLKADRFQAKKFDSIFDQPSDRLPRHDWPSSR